MGGGVPVGKLLAKKDIILYVDATNGEDTTLNCHGWSVEKPFKTLNYAYTYAQRFLEPGVFSLILHFAPGTYDYGDKHHNLVDTPIIYDGTNETGEVILTDNAGTSSFPSVYGAGRFFYRNIHFKVSYHSEIFTASSLSYAEFTNCTFEYASTEPRDLTCIRAVLGSVISVSGNTKIILPETFSSNNIAKVFWAFGGSFILVGKEDVNIILEGSPNISGKFTFTYCTKHGIIHFISTTTASGFDNIDAVCCYEGGKVSFGSYKIYTPTGIQSNLKVPEFLSNSSASSIASIATVSKQGVNNTETPIDEGDTWSKFMYNTLDEEYKKVGILKK